MMNWDYMTQLDRRMNVDSDGPRRCAADPDVPHMQLTCHGATIRKAHGFDVVARAEPQGAN